MSVNKLSISGFKAFAKYQEININKLTLIFGYNNTGKSAILRAIPLLAESFKKKEKKYYTHSYLNYNSNSIRGASFSDLKNKTARRIGLGISFDDSDSLYFQLQKDGFENERISTLTKVENSLEEKYRQTAECEYILESESGEKINTLNFDFLKETSIGYKIKDFSTSVSWISSTRKYPPRYFDIGPNVEVCINNDGTGVGETIWYLNENKSESFNLINEWLINTCGREFKMDITSQTSSDNGKRTVSLDTVPVSSETENEENRVAILDSGEGIAQALPVVTLAAMAANGELGDSPIIAIEQPELHLHPNAIVILADFIVECINKNTDARFIIETHSESFLLALQMAIVKKELGIDDFSCYWVSKNSEGSVAEEVELDEDGFIISNWPASVFREVINQSKELIKFRKEKK
ncbi:AAA family ATPase [Photobacterium iliopiscarium]|uniref:AAA family ATPase n=1 Tax=Photobacterium iliopiscarium TaxID=56192 RepID=UPI001E5A1A75|nr:AAA family ATPase [Photobacterium iliopiscarium]MCD9488948.1 AAA family ATPase [Photobacterium iliopiscarium]MCF2245664.1 AAA family ATPase [Photobacterium iliopiscarium]